MSIAIKTDERSQRNTPFEDLERTRYIGSTEAKNQERDSHLVGTATNLEHQMGTALTPEIFLQKLRKINPDIHAMPLSKHAIRLFLALPDGRGMVLPPLENRPQIPEWSVMSEKEEKNPFTQEKYRRPWAESIRGWRTNLLRMIQDGIITKVAAEKEFGVGQRASWRNLTGSGTTTEGIL